MFIILKPYVKDNKKMLSSNYLKKIERIPYELPHLGLLCLKLELFSFFVFHISKIVLCWLASDIPEQLKIQKITKHPLLKILDYELTFSCAIDISMCSVDKLMQILAVLKVTHYSSKTVTVKHPVAIEILYFFGCKTEFFFSLPQQSQKSGSISDGSRFLGLFRKGKICIIGKLHRTDLVNFSLQRGKPCLVAEL